MLLSLSLKRTPGGTESNNTPTLVPASWLTNVTTGGSTTAAL